MIEEGKARGEFRGIDAFAAAVIPLAALGMYVDALLAGEIETLPDRLEATVLLRELREHNPLLFDFVVKRALRSNGKALAGSIFETRRFFDPLPS